MSIDLWDIGKKKQRTLKKTDKIIKLIKNYKNKESEGNKELAEYIVEHGADINKEKKNGETPLFNTCRSENKELVEYLVEHGADLNKIYT
ncbi:hypothetical protein H8356DRAFT_1360433 [Neocallimastix lanati (nom. inval.)]|nr:hypothetical protein H8356DRAFT_1360433 [Neocallimastix sp. JGI-2020a]